MKRLVPAIALLLALGLATIPNEASAASRRPVGGVVGRAFMTRLYYSNAFRGMIPGTGYGGFRRPAFGYRGY